MKYIDIIVPTRNRWAKLQRFLKSVPQSIPDIKLNMIIICDGDANTAQNLILDSERVSEIILIRDHKGAVYCRNLVTQAAEDAVLYCTDDIELMPGAIEVAVKAMAKHFPDEDGVIGFNQGSEHHFSKSGVALVGQPFLQRYPNRKLFNPAYFHFSCQEIERLGNRLGKIHLEEEARLKHYHPSFDVREVDRTHQEARRHRKEDLHISNSRRKSGTIWGAE